MLPPAAPGADSAMSPAETPAAPMAESGGYTICVDVRPDGTFSVHKEAAGERGPMPGDAGAAPADDEGGEMAGEQVEETESIDNIEGALKAVYGIYQENPPEGGGGEDDMQAAFDDQGAM